MRICWKGLLPEAIQDVVEFVSLSYLEKCSITSLAHQRMLCSEWVPSQWESKQLIKHHNNPQVIHTTPAHQLTSWEDKSCMFVRNKSTIKTNKSTILTSNNCLRLKYESIIHNKASSNEKIHLLLSLTSTSTKYSCIELLCLVMVLDLCRSLSWFRQNYFSP